MYSNDYMYAIERSPEYLAHYGIRGMKWGVRKAIESGNSAKLSRQYAKASKKLAKLEKQAGKSKKYARRAALMGVGAAAAGGLAAAGTEGVSNFMKKNAQYAGKAMRETGGAMVGAGQLASKLGAKKIGGKLIGTGYGLQSKGRQSTHAVYSAGTALNTWGKSSSLASKGSRKYAHLVSGSGAKNAAEAAAQAGKYNAAINKANAATKGISNNTIARIGAGAVGAGLAVGAARNAYKAATAQKKAAKFKSEMNRAFAGTKYANGGAPRQGKKRRR